MHSRFIRLSNSGALGSTAISMAMKNECWSSLMSALRSRVLSAFASFAV